MVSNLAFAKAKLGTITPKPILMINCPAAPGSININCTSGSSVTCSTMAGINVSGWMASPFIGPMPAGYNTTMNFAYNASASGYHKQGTAHRVYCGMKGTYQSAFYLTYEYSQVFTPPVGSTCTFANAKVTCL